MNELITTPVIVEELTFTNKALTSATKRIVKAANGVRKNLYDIAATLAKVDESKAYADDGFKSAADYAMKTFGFKKTTAYSLLKVGKDFTDVAKLESNLPHEDGHDFSTTQIEKMLPLPSRETAIELIEAEKITADMSCKEIEKVVKDFNKPDEEPENETENETETKTETKTETETETESEKEHFAHAAISALTELKRFLNPTDAASVDEIINRINIVCF